MESKIKTLVADDNPIYCEAIGEILNGLNNIQSCKLVFDGQEAIDWIKSNPIDLAFIDLEMPKINGIELTKFLKKEHPKTKIIILTSSNSKRQIIELLSLEVGGYVLKNTDKSELIHAIEKVMVNDLYLTKEVYDIYAHFLVFQSKKVIEAKTKAVLTKREIDVIKLICEQLTTAQIAGRLFVSSTTINNHRANIMKKIKTDNVVGMVIYAINKGYYIPH